MSTLETATLELRRVLDVTLRADAALAALLQGDRLYLAGSVPHGAKLPYIVLGSTSEDGDGAGYFMQPGQAGVERLHCWAADKRGAQQVYALTYKALHLVRLTLTGHLWIRGALAYVTDAADRGNVAYQVLADYRIRTVQGGP